MIFSGAPEVRSTLQDHNSPPNSGQLTKKLPMIANNFCLPARHTKEFEADIRGYLVRR